MDFFWGVMLVGGSYTGGTYDKKQHKCKGSSRVARKDEDSGSGVMKKILTCQGKQDHRVLQLIRKLKISGLNLPNSTLHLMFVLGQIKKCNLGTSPKPCIP